MTAYLTLATTAHQLLMSASGSVCGCPIVGESAIMILQHTHHGPQTGDAVATS